MELEFHKKWHDKFEDYLFKELEFLGLKLHDKLKFHKLEFQRGGKLLNIFPKTVLYGHFGPKYTPFKKKKKKKYTPF